MALRLYEGQMSTYYFIYTYKRCKGAEISDSMLFSLTFTNAVN